MRIRGAKNLNWYEAPRIIEPLSNSGCATTTLQRRRRSVARRQVVAGGARTMANNRRRSKTAPLSGRLMVDDKAEKPTLTARTAAERARRERRLATALRENLKRRKEQAQRRADEVRPAERTAKD
jgi:hypothetical protein